jgi:hypothetical protein
MRFPALLLQPYCNPSGGKDHYPVPSAASIASAAVSCMSGET